MPTFQESGRIKDDPKSSETRIPSRIHASNKQNHLTFFVTRLTQPFLLDNLIVIKVFFECNGDESY